MVGGLCAAGNCVLQKDCIFQNIKCVKCGNSSAMHRYLKAECASLLTADCF